MKKIGFVGLGAMGAPMVANLLKAGFPVASYVNRSRDAMERLAPEGLEEVDGPATLGAWADVLMCCVFDEAQNNQVLRGDGGALTHMRPGSVVMLMSTISPGYCKALAAEAAERSIDVIDCPLSGLPQGAIAGTLSLMIGGASATVEACTEVLAPLGVVHHCGEVGAGQITKLANNAMSIGTYSLLLEIRDFVEASGLDVGSFMETLNQSTGRSFVSQNFPLRPGRLQMRGMPAKDVGTCLQVADAMGLSLPMVQQCFDAGTAAAHKGGN